MSTLFSHFFQIAAVCIWLGLGLVVGFNLGLGLGLGVRVRVSVSIINKLMVFMLRKAVLPPNGSAGWRSPGIGGRLPAGYPRRT